MSNEDLVQAIQSGETPQIFALWEQLEAFVKQQAKKRLKFAGNTRGVEFEDLYNSGYIALVAAVKTYDRTTGAAFITWFGYYLRNAFNKVLYNGRKDFDSLDPLLKSVSLDTPLGEDDDGATLADLQQDKNAAHALQSVDDAIFTEQLHKALDEALATLQDEQRRVIQKHYYAGKSYTQIANDERLTVGAVCSLENKGLGKLRRSSAIVPLRDYIEQITPYYLHVGAATFNRTHTSSVEQLAMFRESEEQKRLCPPSVDRIAEALSTDAPTSKNQRAKKTEYIAVKYDT